MNEKQQRNYDLQKRLIEFAVRLLDVVESLPNSVPSFPSFLHHSLLDIRYSIPLLFFVHPSSLLARYSIFNLVAADRPR